MLLSPIYALGSLQAHGHRIQRLDISHLIRALYIEQVAHKMGCALPLSWAGCQNMYMRRLWILLALRRRCCRLLPMLRLMPLHPAFRCRSRAFSVHQSTSVPATASGIKA